VARLFAYGTLRCPEILEKVIGTRLEGVPGRVNNHACLCVRGEHYPGLVLAHGSEVDGLVYTFPTYLWPRLDAFETEQYIRKPVTVWYPDGKRELVQAYLFRPEYRRLLVRTPWDFEAFLSQGKQAFLDGYLSAHLPAEPKT
jgi:gamma-glutamylcyclotransferase (GGCT)/AIG2-like uncharacterized protein YtfP